MPTAEGGHGAHLVDWAIDLWGMSLYAWTTNLKCLTFLVSLFFFLGSINTISKIVEDFYEFFCNLFNLNFPSFGRLKWSLSKVIFDIVYSRDGMSTPVRQTSE